MEPHDIPHMSPLYREPVRTHGSAVAMAQGCSPQEDASMLHAVHYPRDLIADRVRFTPADQAQTDLPPSVFGYLLLNQLVELLFTLWCRHVICSFQGCISLCLAIE